MKHLAIILGLAVLAGCHDAPSAPVIDCTQKFWPPIYFTDSLGRPQGSITYPMPLPPECKR